VLPELVVDDLEVSVAFYALLGFTIVYRRPVERFAYLRAGAGVELMLEQVDPADRLHPEVELAHPYGRGMNLSIDVVDVAAVHAALLDAAHPVRHRPQERWYARTHDEIGTLEMTVADPDGYLVRPTQDIGTRPRPGGQPEPCWLVVDRRRRRARLRGGRARFALRRCQRPSVVLRGETRR